MASKPPGLKSIVVVRTKPQAAAYNAKQAAGKQAAARAAQRKMQQTARNRTVINPLANLRDARRAQAPKLPLVTPAQAVFPGSGRVRQQPVKASVVAKPSRTGYVGSGKTAPPHPAVGTGKKVIPGPSHNAAPQQVVPGNGQTRATIPASTRPRLPLGGGAPTRAPAGRRTAPPPPTPGAPGLPALPSLTTAPTAASGDPFAGLSPQQIVEQMLAPQYAPIDAQQKTLETQYANQQATINDFGGLSTLAGSSQGPGSIPAEYLAGLSSQQQAEAAYQHSQNEQKLTDARAAVASQAPKLLYDLYSAQTTQQANAAKLQLQQWSALNTALNQQANTRIRGSAAQALIARANADRRLKGNIAYDTSQQRWAALTQRQKEAKVRALDSDRRFKVSMLRAGIADDANTIRAKEVEARYRNGGYTRSQIGSLQKTAGRIAQDAWVGKDTVQTDPSTGKPVHGKTHQSYQEAIREMLAEGVPLVLAQRALNAYWKTPGEYNPAFERPGEGRPKVSFQERQAAAKGTRKTGNKRARK